MVFPEAWIPSAERKPTERDADVYGCVLVYHAYQGVMVTGWFQVGENSLITHWARTPEPPEKA